VKELTIALASERLRYESLTAEHAAKLFDVLTDPRVTEHIGGGPSNLEAMQLEFRFLAAGPAQVRANDRWFNFACRLKEAPIYIGRIQATCYGEWAEIAYVFGVEWWGRGYATEATRWLEGHVAATVGVNDFWATVGPANARSIALLERLDYEETSRLPERPLASYEPGDRCFRKRI
jgi:RimJ/RimL family protein N-acetyltransferase